MRSPSSSASQLSSFAGLSSCGSSKVAISSQKIRNSRKLARAVAEVLEQRQMLSTLALWYFDEGSGTTTADATPNGNTATLHGGSTWDSSGCVGSGLAFDGSGYLPVADSSDLNMPEQ